MEMNIVVFVNDIAFSILGSLGMYLNEYRMFYELLLKVRSYKKLDQIFIQNQERMLHSISCSSSHILVRQPLLDELQPIFLKLISLMKFLKMEMTSHIRQMNKLVIHREKKCHYQKERNKKMIRLKSTFELLSIPCHQSSGIHIQVQKGNPNTKISIEREKSNSR